MSLVRDIQRKKQEYAEFHRCLKGSLIPIFLFLIIITTAVAGITYILTAETVIQTTEVRQISEITITEEYYIKNTNTANTSDYLNYIINKVT